MDKRKRIAIYGGTFDPVHSGHLEIARRVSQLFEIDEFLFVPARLAPHKLKREVSSGFHRYAMLALATREDARLCVSTFELERPERQYTVDTLEHYCTRLGESADLFFVMGADSWSEITSWHEWERLMRLTTLIVVTRPGFEFTSPNAHDAEVVDVRGQSAGFAVALKREGEKKVYITDVVNRDVSATAVRQAASENDYQRLEELVTSEVANYIRKYGLYRNTNEA
ncbi:MAG: nicotinate-nucleotide adenylyltransferase [Acidobacteriota bacterium]|nr:nicotinate-nucleotide adenylyltransferase [Acidobacteriota bacterium]